MVQVFDYIQRKKDRKKEKRIRRKLIIITKTRTGLEQGEKKMKQNYIALVYKDYLYMYIICTY